MQLEQAEKLDDLKAKQEKDKIELENSHMSEFQDFNARWEKRLEDHRAKASEMIDAMSEKQSNDRKELIDHLEKHIPSQPKCSSELLTL